MRTRRTPRPSRSFREPRLSQQDERAAARSDLDWQRRDGEQDKPADEDQRQRHEERDAEPEAADQEEPGPGSDLRELFADRVPRAVGPAAFGVLVSVRYLVGGDAQRRHTSLARDHLGEAQGARLAVVVVAEEPRRELEANVPKPVCIEQRASDLRARHPRVIRNCAIAPEHRLQENLGSQGKSQWDEEEQPDRDGHSPALPYGAPPVRGGRPPRVT